MSAYISIVANKLQGKLPPLVTKEELMNFYLHDIKAKGGMDTNVTVINLVQAANLVNIKVKGKSKLEINVPIHEQWRYITEGITPINKLSLRERLENNKEDIIKAYERGVTTQEIADAFHCCVGTMNTYIKRFGIKPRKRGRIKIGEGVLRETGTERKRRRKKRAE